MPATAPRNSARVLRHGRPACYSITSSARASNLAGMVRPSAFAVLRLMTSSNLVGCCTGISPVPTQGLATNQISPREHTVFTVRTVACWAGQRLIWVKVGKAQGEQMFSASPSKADIAQRSRDVCFVPHSDIARFLRSPRRRSREARREDLRRAGPFLRLGLVWT